MSYTSTQSLNNHPWKILNLQVELNQKVVLLLKIPEEKYSKKIDSFGSMYVSSEKPTLTNFSKPIILSLYISFFSSKLLSFGRKWTFSKNSGSHPTNLITFVGPRKGWKISEYIDEESIKFAISINALDVSFGILFIPWWGEPTVTSFETF